MLRILACCFVLACSSPAPAPAPTTPTPPPTPTEGSAAQGSATSSTQGLGEHCGVDHACPAGQECVHYFGIAGPKGPEFTSCEIRCTDGAACPAGTTCVTIADGPGQVCRP